MAASPLGHTVDAAALERLAEGVPMAGEPNNLVEQLPHLIRRVREDEDVSESLLAEYDDLPKHIYSLMVGVNQIFYLAVGVLAALGAVIGVAYRSGTPDSDLARYAALAAFPLLAVILRQGADTYTEVATIGGYRRFLEHVLNGAKGFPLRVWESAVAADRLSKKASKFGAVPAMLVFVAAATASSVAAWDLAAQHRLAAILYAVVSLVIAGFIVSTFWDQAHAARDSYAAALGHWKSLEDTMQGSQAATSSTEGPDKLN